MKLLEVSKLESLLNDLIKCQEEAGVIMTDAKYVHEASMNLEDRIKDITNCLNRLIEKWEEQDEYRKHGVCKNGLKR